MSIQELQENNNGVFLCLRKKKSKEEVRESGAKTPLKPFLVLPCAPPRTWEWARRPCSHMQACGPHLDPNFDLRHFNGYSTSLSRQNNHFSNTWNYQNAPKTKTRSNYKNTLETQNYQNAPETLNQVPTPSDGYQTFPHDLCLPKVEIHCRKTIKHFFKAYDLPKVEIFPLKIIITTYGCLK